MAKLMPTDTAKLVKPCAIVDSNCVEQRDQNRSVSTRHDVQMDSFVDRLFCRPMRGKLTTLAVVEAGHTFGYKVNVAAWMA